MWTQFWDMHSGGGLKEKWHFIYIEAPEEEAKVIFYNRFGHNPERVTCTCCGDDYAIEEGEYLEKLTSYHRKEQPLDEVLKSGVFNHAILEGEVLFLFDKDIKPGERTGSMPQQGYVWVD